jgi:hypothetical protein
VAHEGAREQSVHQGRDVRPEDVRPDVLAPDEAARGERHEERDRDRHGEGEGGRGEAHPEHEPRPVDDVVRGQESPAAGAEIGQGPVEGLEREEEQEDPDHEEGRPRQERRRRVEHGAEEPLDDPLDVAALEAQAGQGPTFQGEPGEAHRREVRDRGGDESGDADVGAARLATAGAEVLDDADHEHDEGRSEARARDHSEGLGGGERARGQESEGHRRDRRAREEEAGAYPAGADAPGEPGNAGRPQQRPHAAGPALQELEGQDEEQQPRRGGEEAEGHGHGTGTGGSGHRQKSFCESRRIVTGPRFTRATSIAARKRPVATSRPDDRSLDTNCS